MKDQNFLVLVRHGQSEWNAKNLFTGWKDPGLTKVGEKEASNAGTLIKERNIRFSMMYTSALKRAQITGQMILEGIDQTNIEVIKNQALNLFPHNNLSINFLQISNIGDHHQLVHPYQHIELNNYKLLVRVKEESIYLKRIFLITYLIIV